MLNQIQLVHQHFTTISFKNAFQRIDIDDLNLSYTNKT